MKYIIILILLITFSSCVDQSDRIKDTQKRYPKCVIEPCTSLLKREGYEIMVTDTIINQIYAVSYYPFSSTNISSIVNIK